MKGLALTLVIGSIILACCFQLSTAAPASASADAILVYTNSVGVEDAIPLPDKECINFDKPLTTATYIARGSNPVSLYPNRGCTGAAIAIAPNQDYKGSTPILSAKRTSTS